MLVDWFLRTCWGWLLDGWSEQLQPQHESKEVQLKFDWPDCCSFSGCSMFIREKIQQEKLREGETEARTQNEIQILLGSNLASHIVCRRYTRVKFSLLLMAWSFKEWTSCQGHTLPHLWWILEISWTDLCTLWVGKSFMPYQACILPNYWVSGSPSRIPNTLPHSFPISPIFPLPMPEHTCPEIAKLFPQFVYMYTGFWSQPVKNIKHWQLLVPQILGFSRTSHANPGNMYIHGKLLMRRTHLQCWNRGLRRFWDSKAVLGSFSLLSILFWYCFAYFSIISPLISFILFALCLGSSLFLLCGSFRNYY